MDPVQLTRQFLAAYQSLGGPNQPLKEQANMFVYKLSELPEAWSVAENLISCRLANSDEQKKVHRLQGAVILKQKCQDAFYSLSHMEKIQKKDFIYNNYVAEICLKTEFDGPYVRIILQVAAFLASVCYDSVWPNFFDQMNNAILSSPRSMKIILEIIENIPYEIRNNTAWNNTQKVNARDLFLEKRDFIFLWCGLAFEAYKQAAADQKQQYIQLVKGSFLCILSWVQSNLDILSHPGLITKMIENLHTQEIFMIFGEILRSCLNTLTPQSNNHQQQPSVTAQQQLSNISTIILFMMNQQNSIYGSSVAVGHAIKTQTSTSLCQTYALIISKIVLRYPQILENPNVLPILLRIMLNSLRHKSYNVSDRAVEFGINLYDEVQRIGQWKNPEFQSIILNFYTEAYLIVLNKAMRSNLPEELYSVEQEGQERQDMDENNDLDIPGSYSQVSFTEYRRSCNSFFQVVYNIYRDVCQQAGTQKYFAPLNTLMNGCADSSMAVRQMEVALFAISSAVLSMTDEDYIPYIQKIIELIINAVTLDTNINIRLEAYKLLANFHQNINSSRELSIKAIEYLLNAVDNSKICIETSTYFSDLTEHRKTHDFYELFQPFASFFKLRLPFLAFNVARERMVKAILSFVKKTQSYQKQHGFYLNIICNLFNSLAEQITKDPTILASLFNILQEVTSGFASLELTHREGFILKLADFVRQTTNVLSQILKLCLVNGGVYSPKKPAGPFDSCLKSALGMYPCLLKLSFNLTKLNVQMPIDVTSIISIIDNAAQLFFKNCEQNCMLLGIWQVTLREFASNYYNNTYFNEWLCSYFHKFCQMALKINKITQVDVLKNLIDLLRDVLNFNRQLLFSVMPQFNILVIKSINMNEFSLQKSAMMFLDDMLTQKINMLALQEAQVTQLLLNIFKAFNCLATVTFKPLGNILMKLAAIYNVNFNQKLCQSMISSGTFQQLKKQRIVLLSNILAASVATGDDKSIRRVMIKINDIMTKRHDHPSIWMELQLEMRRLKK